MDERKISLLENMTIKNGCTPNEESIAKKKIAQYAAAMNTHRTKNPTPVHIYEDIPLEELHFRRKWYELKRENRKKWGVE